VLLRGNNVAELLCNAAYTLAAAVGFARPHTVAAAAAADVTHSMTKAPPLMGQTPNTMYSYCLRRARYPISAVPSRADTGLFIGVQRV
jgi:hypothetical protein